MAKEQIISTGELQALLKENPNVEFWNVLTDEYFSGVRISADAERAFRSKLNTDSGAS